MIVFRINIQGKMLDWKWGRASERKEDIWNSTATYAWLQSISFPIGAKISIFNRHHQIADGIEEQKWLGMLVKQNHSGKKFH